jgi:HK97 family phage major capsid protein
VSKLQEIMEKRAKVHADAVVLINAEQTTETRAQVKAMLADVELLGQDIAAIQQSDKQASELAARTGVVADTENRGAAVTPAEEYRSAYFDFMQNGRPNGPKNIRGGASAEQIAKLDTAKAAWESMSAEQQRSAHVKQAAYSRLSAEKRDQQAGTQSITYTEGNLGGYFVPAGFVYDIEQATKFYANLMDGSSIRIMETATGNVLPYPTSNDTNQAWTLLSETTQIVDNGTSPNYPTTGSVPSPNPGNVLASQVTFGAYKGSTGLVRVSLELMQDSAFSLEAFLKEAFAVRLGRGYEYYLTLGSGVNAPLGIIPAIAASGAVAVTAAGSAPNDGVAGNTGANSIGYQDMVNLTHSVDPTYRRGAKFMFHDQTLASLQTRVDKFGRPLWVPSVKEGVPDTICGYQYVINQSIAQIAPSATTVAFGQWSKFVARKVRDLSIARLDERFADYGEVAYVGFSRIDSRLVDAGTHPLNVLTMHS